MNNKKYFKIVLDYSIKKGILLEKVKDIVLKDYAPTEENAPIYKFKNSIFCAYCDDFIGLDDMETILYLLDFKEFYEKNL
jgi:hypothetical protein